MWLPPFKYVKGLYANEGEYTTKDGNSFSGPYYKTHDGKIYSGNGPSKDQVELQPDLHFLGEKDSFLDFHGELKTSQTQIIYPEPEDYNRGYFLRYFVRDNRDKRLTEVDKKAYTRYTQELFITGTEVKWILDKPVKDIFNEGYLYKGAATRNRENTLQAGLVIEELRDYITDYGQFADIESDVEGYQFKDLPRQEKKRLIQAIKPNIQEEPLRKRKPRFKSNKPQISKIKNNLYTAGGRFKIKGSNIDYKGFYHIHPTMGPMEGAVHTNQPHRKLVPYLLNYEAEQQSSEPNTGVVPSLANPLPPSTSSPSGGSSSGGTTGYY